MPHRPLIDRRTFGQWAAAGTVAAVAPAGLHAQPSPRARDALVIGIALEPVTLDPTASPGAPIGEVVHLNVLEGLTKANPGGSISPLLAQDWQVEPDGLTYTFALRPGLRFHDGTPCDAAAVKANFDRAAQPGSGNKARATVFDNLAAVTVADARTLILTLKNADGALPFRLAESPCVILSPATFAAPTGNPVGTGPYRIESWQRGNAVTLVRWDGFRDAAAVKLRRVQFRFIADPAAQVTALLAGDIDTMPRFDAIEALPTLRADPRFTVAVGATAGKGLLAMNHRRTPLGDVRVRRAISHAIDRKAFIDAVFQGLATPIGSHAAPNELGQVDLTGVYPFDPDRARALLRVAGVTTPRPLGLALPPPAYARRGGEVVAQMLGRVGITTRAEPMEWAQWLAGPFRGEFDLTIINHVEPLDIAKYGNPNYYFGYRSEALRQLLVRHAQARRGAPQLRAFADVQRHLAQDAVNAWIFNPQQVAVSRRGLRGVWIDSPFVVNDVAAMAWEGRG